jgi:protein TonB
MSYAQRKELGANRTLAIVLVAIVNLTLGYAIVTGLAYNIVKKAAEDLKTFDVEEEPPPPEEEPPPPPEEIPDVPPPPAMPEQIVQIAPPQQTIQLVPREIITPPPPPPPPAPPPPQPRVSQAASARGDVRTLFTDDDYPESARDANATGTARARLTIGTNGRVSGCTITQSTGNSALDRATCSVLTRRARFTPAKDQNGNPIADTYNTPPIRFVLQD